MIKNSNRVACALACVLLGGAAMAQASGLQGRYREHFDAATWQAVNDSLLDSLRGGFQINPSIPGLAISFGFTRSVTINGDLASQVHFTLPDLSHISVDQAKLVSDALAQVKIVQIGSGNSVGTGNTGALAGNAPMAAGTNSPATGSGNLGAVNADAAPNTGSPALSSIGAAVGFQVPVLPSTTVIQNTLNNQHIQTLTQIDTGVNSLGMLRTMNSQGILRDAIIGAVGVR